MLRINKSLEQLERIDSDWSAREGKICLDKNEAPFSPLSDCEQFFDKLKEKEVFARTYPDPRNFYKKLSQFTKEPVEKLMATFGSEQALRFTFELMVEPGDEVVYPEPTFAMIDVFTTQFGAKAKKVQHRYKENLNINEIVSNISLKTKLIVIASPDNPTGTRLSVNDFEVISKEAQKVGALVVSDEAYFHYSDISAQELTDKFENIVVTRTFSKGWGLAGLRVGYIIAHPKTIRLFRKLKPIDEISTFSMLACEEVLDNESLLVRNVEQVHKWQNKFGSFKENYIVTYGNFILLELSDTERSKTESWFNENQILYKKSFSHDCVKGMIRFSVTKDTVMEKIYTHFKELLGRS